MLCFIYLIKMVQLHAFMTLCPIETSNVVVVAKDTVMVVAKTS